MVILAGMMAASRAGAEGLDLKSMILMPGPLTQAHAEQEPVCDSCHSSFDKAAQDSLCLDCHEEVAADRKQKQGFHGLSPMASSLSCKRCHTDHKGRDYNIVRLDLDIFEHQHTNFPLAGKHVGTACSSCHQAGTEFREADGSCHACHQEQDQHRGSLGKECADCHTADGWHKPATFDHDNTDFSLQGRHRELECSSCHAGEQYSFDNSSCIGCHQLRDVHLGRYGQDCERCHTQDDWSTPSFDHTTETDFRLTGKHQDSACQACHFDGMEDNKPSTECVSCHRSSDIHSGRHGSKCASCHNTSGWDQARFDHGKEANWPLSGKHQDIACLQCHRGSLDDPLDGECKSCHLTDNVHKAENLDDCGSCHQPTEWSETDGFDHELAKFPLEGMHAIAPCESCHESHEFLLARNQCKDCHLADDVHQSSMGSQCESCHTPNGWLLWSFDHDSKTDFKLTGAHAGLSCDSCHHGDGADDVPRDCVGCHAAEDRHEGSFGGNCGRCHSSDSFGDVQWRK